MTTVTIGGAACTGAVVTDSVGHGAVVCTAPSGPGSGDVRLQVSVAGSGNASVPFLYTPPQVTGLSVAVCPADVNFGVRVLGTNLGRRTGPDPVVYIGDKACSQPLVVGTGGTEVQCVALASPVGAYPVKGAWPMLPPGHNAVAS